MRKSFLQPKNRIENSLRFQSNIFDMNTFVNTVIIKISRLVITCRMNIFILLELNFSDEQKIVFRML